MSDRSTLHQQRHSSVKSYTCTHTYDRVVVVVEGRVEGTLKMATVADATTLGRGRPLEAEEALAMKFCYFLVAMVQVCA
jgi:hypothetical protein